MVCALIMAGGNGTRFWPISTDKKPKQFLNLLGKKSMLQITFERIVNFIPKERIFIVTSAKYAELIKQQIPELLDTNIIYEPVKRDTAPCILLSALIIKKYYKNATLIVLPSDHYIQNDDDFINTLKPACDFIDHQENSLVTLGIKPDRPETGYGYIKCSDPVFEDSNGTILNVEKFVEKPDIVTATYYLKNKNYMWNCGIFIWKIDTILELSKIYISDIYDELIKIYNVCDNNFNNILKRIYNNIRSISIDYAILENASHIYCIPCTFKWDDLGSWKSFERFNATDELGNITNKNTVLYKSKKNIVLTNKKILLNNIENLIVVETDDYILISSKDNEQEIKLAKNLL